MAAGKPCAYKDNECGGREGYFGMRNKVNGFAKLEYKPVQNGIKDYERGHGQGYDQDSLEYRSKVRQKDAKERAVTNGRYLSVSSRSDSGSSGSGGSRKHGLGRSALDREPGELWSDGSDEVIDSETRIDKGPDKENVENVSQVKNKKRKFSPIVWGKDDKEVSRTIKSRDTIVTTNLPPSPALVKSSKRLLKPKFSLEEDRPTSPTDNKQTSLEASPSKVDLRSDLSEFPAETLPMLTEDQWAKKVETVSPNDDYIPPRTIISSRWGNGADSHADGGEISDYILKLKRNSGVEPTDAGPFNKCASPEVGEVKIEAPLGSWPDGCDRSSSRDCYCEEGNNGYVEIGTDRNYDGARASYSDTESEDSCFTHGTLKPLHRQQRSVNMLQGCRSVDEFERLNKINEGTYGIVYRAKDKRTGDIVALKKVKMDKEREGFPLTSLREINILLSCDHPSIVDVKEVVVGSSLDSIFMVMEYMEHDLKELTETMKQPFSQSEVKCLMLQLLSGVKYLHDNWVIHRDLKTSNLLLNNCGELKICDFGLARQYGSPLKPYTPLVVTLWYRSPELLLGAKQYSTAIDMWSLGCIMAELLLKEPLFKGKTEFDQLDKIFKMLGTPNESIWPGYFKLPGVKVNFIQHQLPAFGDSGVAFWPLLVIVSAI